MDADLDTLATALYVRVDDLLKTALPALGFLRVGVDGPVGTPQREPDAFFGRWCGDHAAVTVAVDSIPRLVWRRRARAEYRLALTDSAGRAMS